MNAVGFRFFCRGFNERILKRFPHARGKSAGEEDCFLQSEGVAQQQAVWEQIANPLGTFPPMGPTPDRANYAPWATDIPGFRCPSDPGQGLPAQAALEKGVSLRKKRDICEISNTLLLMNFSGAISSSVSHGEAFARKSSNQKWWCSPRNVVFSAFFWGPLAWLLPQAAG